MQPAASAADIAATVKHHTEDVRADRTTQSPAAADEPAADVVARIWPARNHAQRCNDQRGGCDTNNNLQSEAFEMAIVRADATSEPSLRLDGAMAVLSIEAIQQLATALRYEFAAPRLFERAQQRMSVPAALVAQIAPQLKCGPVAAALVLLADGDPAELATGLVTNDVFPATVPGRQRALLLAGLAARRGNADHRRRLAVTARLMAFGLTASPDALGSPVLLGLLHDLCARVDDIVLRSLLPPGGEARDELDDLEQLLALPPAKLPFLALADRASAQSSEYSRNTPCPCGSGKKYKRCHLSRELPRAVVPAQLTAETITPIPLDEVASMPLTELRDDALQRVVETTVGMRLTGLAERAIAELERRPHVADEVTDRSRHQLAEQRLRVADAIGVTQQFERMRSPGAQACGSVVAAALAIATTDATTFAILDSVANAGVSEPSGHTLSQVAISLAAFSPALALVLLRAVVASLPDVPSPHLLRNIKEARLRLGLPTADPVETLATGAADARRARDTHERVEAELRHDIDRLTARCAGLVELTATQARSLRALEDQRAALRAAPPTATAESSSVEPPEVRALRARVEALQELVRDRNAELAALRRARAAPAHRPSPTSASAPSIGDSDDPGLEVKIASEALDAEVWRRLLVPVWTGRSRADLGRVPPHVGREALRTVSALAAGDGAAWRGTKRTKRLSHPVLMARLGIHHRLLFRIDNTELIALEIVPRKQLAFAIDRYLR